MILRRTYLTCCLVGLCAFAACEDDAPSHDAGIGTVFPGTAGGTSGGVGGTTGGGTTGGAITGGGTTGGFPSGGIPSGGIPSGGIPSGSITGGTTGGTGGTMGGRPSGTGGTGGTGATTGGTGGTTGGTGGTTGGTGGTTGGTGGTAGAGACTPAPAKLYTQTVWESGGPSGDYTVVRPATLGEGGFMHPPIAWGNGVTTTPDLYTELLDNLAKQGFVVIGDPGVVVTADIVRQGLEWLIAQGTGSGKFAGKLATNCAGTIGYSMGGGSAVGAAAHPAVKATVSMHGLQDNAGAAKGPILLTTSEGDTFVTKDGFVVPCYQASTKQPTMLASHPGGDHLDPLFNGGEDAAPAIAWLRYWIYGDQSQKDYFFGANCKICNWPDVRRKNHPEWTGR